MTVPRAKTWVEIRADALRSNIQSLRSLLAPGVQFCAVVKGNAYGHDLDSIVRLCLLEGVTHFAVDSVDEAHRIRGYAPDVEIIILGYTIPERREEVVIGNYIQTVYAKQTILDLAALALKHQTRARINLKVETGTQRQGILASDLSAFLTLLKQEGRSIEFTGLASHFANAEDLRQPEFTRKQADQFEKFVYAVKQAGFEPTYLHLACSAAAITAPETQHNLARFGISLYGLWSSDGVRLRNRASAQPIELRPVLAWKTRIAQIKEVPAYAPIGYGCTFVPKQPMRIAVLPFGYYDGYQRTYRDKAEVLIHGARCPILGTICMNICMADVSHVPQVKEDDTVTILGQDGMHRITAEDMASWSGTINYEVVTHIGSHLPRIIV